MNELALFAGAGGGILGGKLLGWRTVCAVEWDAYAASVLVARQNDGTLDPFPVWDDVQTFDGRPWRGIVDVVSGGFPCQDISAAGKGAGITGERSGMWRHMARIIGEVRPKYALVENSPMLTGRGLGVVLGDLAEMGYDAKWGVLGAVDAGAPHKRDRIWIVADASEIRLDARRTKQSLQRARENGCAFDMANATEIRSQDSQEIGQLERERSCFDGYGIRGEKNITWWNTDPADAEDATESGMGRVAHGVANRVDRIACLGNGQVPAVVRLAWEILSHDDTGRGAGVACVRTGRDFIGIEKDAGYFEIAQNRIKDAQDDMDAHLFIP